MKTAETNITSESEKGAVSTEEYPLRKTSALADIRMFAQEMVTAIAAVTGVDVTIVDENLVRIAGSGKYVDEINSVLTPFTVSDQVLKTGKIFILENPREESVCNRCSLKESCRELAEISLPIILNGKAVGNMALIAFTETQRTLLLENKDAYIEFNGKMARLLSHRIESQEKSDEVILLNQQLEALIDKMDHGILFVGSDRNIQLFNQLAGKWLGPKLVRRAPVSRLIPEVNWQDIQPDDHLVTRENDTLSISVKRIEKLGFLVEIHKISFLQEKEHEIRRRMSKKPPVAVASFNDLIGYNPQFMAAVNVARKYSQVDATVLISAETGTGKELFAHSIHNLSNRRNGPFVAINCAALPQSLLESELFGYSSGAFTGAKRGGKMGLFEQAHRGTIFLDEIAEMPLPLQSSLLRVLEEKEIRRIGDDKLIPVDVRIIAATNKKIKLSVEQGEFREDLFYRLNMLRLRLPPLRERVEDIPLLVQHFAIQSCRIYRRKPVAFTKEAINLLCSYHWPGNIRELYNVVQRAVLLNDQPLVEIDLIRNILSDYAGEIDAGLHHFSAPLTGSFKDFTRHVIEELLQRHHDVEEVSRLLGISKTTIWRRLNSK